MSTQVVIDGTHEVGIATVSGPVDDTTLLAALDQLYLSADWHPGYDAIWDGRGITKLVVDPAGSTGIARRVQSYASRIAAGRTAVVTQRTMDRLFAEMLFARLRCPEQQYALFDSMDSALLWAKGVERALRWKVNGAPSPAATASRSNTPAVPAPPHAKREPVDPHAAVLA